MADSMAASGSSSSSSSSSNQSQNPIGSVELAKDKNDNHVIMLRNPKGASVDVSCQGGQVLSWKTERGEELLFVSSKVVYKPPHPIRGGIPICFPEFGCQGTNDRYGFARERIWTIDRDPPALPEFDSTGMTYADLLLTPSDRDLKIWPHKFRYHLRVALANDGSLTLITRICNVCTKSFKFTTAYQTYLAVSDIGEMRIEGMEYCNYRDRLQGGELFTEQGISLAFDSEVDRVYTDVDEAIGVFDHVRKRTIRVEKGGFPDMMVWNPWEKKAKGIADLGKNEYRKMLCVGGALVEQIKLQPGKEWLGHMKLSLVLSTNLTEAEAASNSWCNVQSK